jgi:deoxyribonuclease V
MKIRELHSWNVSFQEAAQIQRELRALVKVRGGPKGLKLVAGADVAYEKKEKLFFAVVMLFTFPKLEPIETVRLSGTVSFPYVPGYLSFREAPILLQAFSRLRKRPGAVLIDGQGIAHPRGFGLASHVGFFLNIPTIGCAKSRLVGEHGEVGERAGDSIPLVYEGRKVGVVLRTKDRVRPIYVSPGHKIGFSESVRLVLCCTRGYRIPEPTRLADIEVSAFKREMLRKD